jgi:hypothetical protein
VCGGVKGPRLDATTGAAGPLDWAVVDPVVVSCCWGVLLVSRLALTTRVWGEGAGGGVQWWSGVAAGVIHIY